MGQREQEYLEIAKRYTRDELSDISMAFAMLVQEMERAPFTDLLGPFYLECAAHSSKQARGEFYTPPEISKLMAGLLFDVAAVKAAGQPISISEPACGSGGMVLAVAELFAPDGVDLMRVTAQDINPVAADMAYINLTLWGIPSRIVLGNTISGSTRGEWKNVHWFRVGEESRILAERALDLMHADVPVSPMINLDQIRNPGASKDGQFLFDF